VRLPARAGEAILVHNYVWHGSAVNRSGKARRGLSVCYMDASTRCLRTKRAPRVFVRVFEGR
jgi:phytanoyl-CoA hydroxylase